MYLERAFCQCHGCANTSAILTHPFRPGDVLMVRLASWLRPSAHRFAGRGRFGFCCLVSLLIGNAVQAQNAPDSRESADSPPLREARHAEKSFSRSAQLPKWARPLAAIPESRRNDAVVIRLAETQLHVSDDSSLLVNRAVAVHNTSALSAIGQFTIEFVPEYQKLELHQLRILRGETSLDRMATVNLRFLERETGLESGVYSGQVSVSLLIEDVRVGDTLQFVYSIRGRNPVLGNLYSEATSWDAAAPVELRRVSLVAPRERKIAWRMHGDFRTESVRPAEVQTEPPRVSWRPVGYRQAGMA
ncbi:MAG: DUF3857 domain-containing protein [Burkholderiales bacterium]